MDIEFLDESPQFDTRVSMAQQIITTLRKRPDEWAIVRRWPKSSKSSAYSYAQYLRRTYEDIEARARIVGDEAQVVARYIEEDVA